MKQVEIIWILKRRKWNPANSKALRILWTWFIANTVQIPSARISLSLYSKFFLIDTQCGTRLFYIQGTIHFKTIEIIRILLIFSKKSLCSHKTIKFIFDSYSFLQLNIKKSISGTHSKNIRMKPTLPILNYQSFVWSYFLPGCSLVVQLKTNLRIRRV